MPYGFDPNEMTAPLLLSFDAHLPPAKRAKFVCRYVSDRQVRQMAALYETANLRKTRNVQTLNALNRAIVIAVVSINGGVLPELAAGENAENPPASALDEFSMLQKLRIVEELPMAIALDEGDKKKSAWQPDAGSGATAATTPPVSV